MLLDLYAAHTAKSAPKTPAIDPKEAAEAAKLAARRGAQVEGGKAVGTKSAQPNQSADANDEDSMFAAYANAANKRIAKRYS
jgi:hypothetical protein